MSDSDSVQIFGDWIKDVHLTLNEHCSGVKHKFHFDLHELEVEFVSYIGKIMRNQVFFAASVTPCKHTNNNNNSDVKNMKQQYMIKVICSLSEDQCTHDAFVIGEDGVRKDPPGTLRVTVLDQGIIVSELNKILGMFASMSSDFFYILTVKMLNDVKCFKEFPGPCIEFHCDSSQWNVNYVVSRDLLNNNNNNNNNVPTDKRIKDSRGIYTTGHDDGKRQNTRVNIAGEIKQMGDVNVSKDNKNKNTLLALPTNTTTTTDQPLQLGQVETEGNESFHIKIFLGDIGDQNQSSTDSSESSKAIEIFDNYVNSDNIIGYVREYTDSYGSMDNKMIDDVIPKSDRIVLFSWLSNQFLDSDVLFCEGEIKDQHPVVTFNGKFKKRDLSFFAGVVSTSRNGERGLYLEIACVKGGKPALNCLTPGRRGIRPPRGSLRVPGISIDGLIGILTNKVNVYESLTNEFFDILMGKMFSVWRNNNMLLFIMKFKKLESNSDWVAEYSGDYGEYGSKLKVVVQCEGGIIKLKALCYKIDQRDSVKDLGFEDDEEDPPNTKTGSVERIDDLVDKLNQLLAPKSRWTVKNWRWFKAELESIEQRLDNILFLT